MLYVTWHTLDLVGGLGIPTGFFRLRIVQPPEPIDESSAAGFDTSNSMVVDVRIRAREQLAASNTEQAQFSCSPIYHEHAHSRRADVFCMAHLAGDRPSKSRTRKSHETISHARHRIS